MPPWAGFLIFFTIVTAIYSSAHYYLYAWLIRWAAPSKGLRRVIGLSFLLLVVSFPASRVLARVDFNSLTYSLTLVSSVWMGTSLYFFLLALVLDLGSGAARLFFYLAGRPLRLSPASGRALAGLVGAGVLLLGAAAWQEAHSLKVVGLEVPLRNLPSEMDGFSLVQISDFHFGMLNGKEKLTRVVGQVNDLRPDLVVITGDLVDEAVSHMEEMSGPLRQLQSRHGVLAVTGNHEYYAGVDRAAAILKEAGVEVLRNRMKVLPSGLQILGVDDPTGWRRMGEPAPDVEGLLSGLDPGKPSLFLYHQPVLFPQASSRGVGLQVSGHTHGGQLFPILFISRLIYSRTPGLHREGDSFLYVSRGAGTWGPPMRMGAPPEIAHIRLRSPK